MTIAGILFDLDGTLIDSYDAIAAAANETLRALDLPTRSPEEIRRNVGPGLPLFLKAVSGEAYVERAIPIFRAAYRRVVLDETRVLPGVEETLEGLRGRGYRLGCATNKIGDVSRHILDHLGLLERLDAVLGAGDVPELKPHPAMLSALLGRLGVEKEQALYVGDMPLDVVTGERAGVRVWLVPGGSAPVEELHSAGAERLLPRFPDLLEHLPAR
jgi:phosphoglycolate phosphatase